MSIDYKSRTKKPEGLSSEIEKILGGLKEKKKKRYAYWSEAVGETIAKVAIPVYSKNGVLMVKVEDPVWRFELTRRKSEVLESVNKKVKKNNQYKDIIFK